MQEDIHKENMKGEKGIFGEINIETEDWIIVKVKIK